MPVEIEGITYFTQDEVVREVGVSRHTLWRWRRAGAIPTGQLDRRGHVLFTASQVTAIKNYANRVEPAAASDTGQLRLFNNGHKKRGGG